MTYVFDACALIAFFKKEEGFETVKALIASVDARKDTACVSIVNLLEIYYGFAGDKGFNYASAVIGKIQDSSVSVIDVISPAVFKEAGRFKVTYKIPLADCFAAATAFVYSAALVTSDHQDFEKISRHEPISFLWLPARPQK
jgi:predicted nucleic acid-binding protein